MTKKILLSLVLLNSGISFSNSVAVTGKKLTSNNVAEINSSFLNEKGKQYLRNTVISEDLYRVGSSKSSQNIEIFSGNGSFSGNSTYEDYNNKSIGFSLGTTSEIKRKSESNIHWTTGVQYGFVGSKINYGSGLEKETLRTLGVNAYLGARKDTSFALFTLGGATGKSESTSGKYTRDNFALGGELGKIYKVGDRQYIYPYIGYDFYRYYIGGHTSNGVTFQPGSYSYSNINAGLSYTIDYAKWQYKLQGRWNSELGDGTDSRTINYLNGSSSNEDGFKIQGDNATLGVTIGYYLDESLRVSLEALGVYNRHYRDTIYGAKINYIF